MNPEYLEFEGITFQVRRVPRKRNISVNLRPNGSANIRAAVRCPLQEILSFLEEKRDWVKSVIAHFDELRKKHPRFEIKDGVEVPLLGEKYKILIRKEEVKKIRLKVVEKSFELSVPTDFVDTSSCQEELRHVLRKHYKKIAVEILRKRADYWVKQTSLSPKNISFRGQKTRWGSCSPSGAISLNWKLICAEPSVVDYVIIHELCHLKHLNHSSNFWQLVEVYCPQWREKKAWLRSRNFEFDFLNISSELHLD